MDNETRRNGAITALEEYSKEDDDLVFQYNRPAYRSPAPVQTARNRFSGMLAERGDELRVGEIAHGERVPELETHCETEYLACKGEFACPMLIVHF